MKNDPILEYRREDYFFQRTYPQGLSIERRHGIKHAVGLWYARIFFAVFDFIWRNHG